MEAGSDTQATPGELVWPGQGMFVHACIDGVVAGMKALRPYVTREVDLGRVQVKHDKTFVCDADTTSQEAMQAAFLAHELGIPLWCEEQKFAMIGEAFGDSEFGAFGDPCDGTSLLMWGIPASTVMLSIYNVKLHRQVAACVGFPATGRVVFASEREPTRAVTFDTTTWRPLQNRRAQPCHVWHGTLAGGGVVLIEHSVGFENIDRISGKLRRVLTNDNMQALTAALHGLGKFAIVGSNGCNQAVVAEGGQNIAVHMNTAKGGPWDEVPLLVINAGGSSQGLRINRSGGGVDVELVDPLDVVRSDMKVNANHRDSMLQVVEAVRQSVSS